MKAEYKYAFYRSSKRAPSTRDKNTTCTHTAPTGAAHATLRMHGWVLMGPLILVFGQQSRDVGALDVVDVAILRDSVLKLADQQ